MGRGRDRVVSKGMKLARWSEVEKDERDGQDEQDAGCRQPVTTPRERKARGIAPPRDASGGHGRGGRYAGPAMAKARDRRRSMGLLFRQNR